MSRNLVAGSSPEGRRRALLTGATGFLGGPLARRLVEEGWDVHVIVRPGSRIEGLVELLETELQLDQSQTVMPKSDSLGHRAGVVLECDLGESVSVVPGVLGTRVETGTQLVLGWKKWGK